MNDATPLSTDPRSWELPSTRADGIRIWSPRGIYVLASGAVRSYRGVTNAVELPPTLPGRELPSYLLKEFHGMPNGYYSHALARNYSRGFDVVMLGKMRGARRRIARCLAGARRVIDVGCGAGALASSMREHGFPEVYGIDPCPYALQVASQEVPHVSFVQALAEDTGMPDQHFGGAGVCFVFHELPEAAADGALAELHRILEPGATLAITEPSPIHLRESVWTLLARRHWLGPWYKMLARMVYEPYLGDWLRRDLPLWMKSHGFTVVNDRHGVPFREIVARRD